MTVATTAGPIGGPAGGPPLGSPGGPAGPDGPDGPTRARVQWALVPRVNLLPEEIIRARAFRRTQRLLAATVVATVLLGAAVTGWAQLQVSDARTQLDQAHSRTTQLNAEAARYAEVPRVLAQVDAARAAREQALTTDVLWYRFLDDLANAIPSNVSLGTVSVTMAEQTGVSSSSDPLTPGGLGEVAFAGKAGRFPDVASWLTQVATVHGLDASRLQSATRDGGGASDSAASPVTFTTRVIITSDALSHRYDRKAG